MDPFGSENPKPESGQVQVLLSLTRLGQDSFYALWFVWQYVQDPKLHVVNC